MTIQLTDFIHLPRRIERSVRFRLRKARQQLLDRYEGNAFDGVLDYDWGGIPFSRIAFVSAAVARVQAAKGQCRYLEIGCFNNECFYAIPAEIKVGVDPVRGGTLRMTSDAFFAQNKETFDVIYVDGLHEYGQCQRDAINALAALNTGGFLLLHDLLPLNWKMEHVPRLQAIWSGDVWKVAFELMATTGIDFVVAEADQGVGIARKISNDATYKDLSGELRTQRFRYLFDHRKRLPLRTAEQALTFVRG